MSILHRKKLIMKRVLLFAALTMAFTGMKAQEPADALKFSWYVPGGSARTQAVGGAMGSLGGDLTSLFVNPAGLAFYKTGDLVLSPSFLSGKSRSQYLGSKTDDDYCRLTWGTTGVVMGTGSNGKKNRNFAFALALNKTMDFNSGFSYMGQNFQSSYSQKYLEEIGNIKDGNVVAGSFPYGSSLAFNTFWIDTVGGGSQGNFQFQSRSLPLLSQGLLQANSVQTKGGVTEFALGGGAQLSEKFMIGATFSVPIVFYEKDVEFVEEDPTDDPGNKFNFARVEENLVTRGYGFNVKAGLIYKPQEFWRLGLAFHSPTFYSLNDKYNVTVTTHTDQYKGEQYISTEDITGAESKFEYFYWNPYRVIGSISYVFREIENVTRQRGFITADVEYVNHKASSFFAGEESSSADETYLKSVNTAINNAYKGAFNFRVGGELKFTTIMVRAGAAFYGNPYQDIAGEYGQKVNYSGGLGYRNKGFFIDLTYVHSKTQDGNFAYRLASVPNQIARVKNTQHNILATVGFKF
jgi:hypothetical protein